MWWGRTISVFERGLFHYLSKNIVILLVVKVISIELLDNSCANSVHRLQMLINISILYQLHRWRE